ncbi:hypothetical protein L198_05026 [Cryptococcus wingfieldii CBS 7118]|uniref:AAA+ ATPase domain-containing protein n=1 Tax=Cryptococcus wingfieldii CBS 7118 TaxID=1295528 RepID=A0A1E3J0J8_9TREE|nr:hypothetical protein L198_05026 [Cryptococcus wingfieldii CBS 7118]ODN94175.1 hypothetical protein L198_05026 [Cryptococcus wingfieldii CBS 7118]
MSTQPQYSPPEYSLSALPISRSVKVALEEAGYRTTRDIELMSAEDLSVELAISTSEARFTLQQAEEWQAQIHSATAADLLSTATHPHFSTFSASLDGLIGKFSLSISSEAGSSRKGKERLHTGSIVPGMVVEISGPPGGGKSAIALAVSLSARESGQKERELNGHPEGKAHSEFGEVLIIDTEGAMTTERLYEAARAVVEGDKRLPHDVLQGIHLLRVSTQHEMLALLHTLDEWLESHPKVNLVIIDTLSFHFRQLSLDIAAKRRAMELQVLIALSDSLSICNAADRNLQVIVCNQLATKLLNAENKPANFDTGDRAILMPQLSDSWATSKALRLVVFRGGVSDEIRYVYASMSGLSKTVPYAAFDIDSNGLPCDVPEMLYPTA